MMLGILEWIGNRNLKQRIAEGIRINLIPGLVLWIMGVCLVAIYYLGEFSRPWFNQIIILKETYGFAYSAVSTCFFGGLIPYVFMQLTGRDRLKGLWSGVIFLGYWAIRGIDVDAFYRLQAMVFGTEVDSLTIVSKVLVDQFVYCVVWASPITALFYTWREAGFSLKQWKGSKTWSELFDMILIFTVTTWVVWIPGTAIIYSLPSALQIPLFNLTLCFFVILVSVFSQNESRGG
tara:strand:+ start:395 stop:1096 length:702 start_codon:yes stop_codon:yes gene_type:complete